MNLFFSKCKDTNWAFILCLKHKLLDINFLSTELLHYIEMILQALSAAKSFSVFYYSSTVVSTHIVFLFEVFELCKSKNFACYSSANQFPYRLDNQMWNYSPKYQVTSSVTGLESHTVLPHKKSPTFMWKNSFFTAKIQSSSWI